MTDHAPNLFLTNLAMVLCVAAVTTVVFQRLRQPVVLGYILAGLIVGPYLPVPLVADRAMVQAISELGLVLLLFGIGLEFTLAKLLHVGATAGIVAVVQVSILLLLGNAAARAFGWSSREALYTGAIVAISSTTIIAKVFEENRIGGRLRQLVLGVLVVEDLIAVLLLAGFTALASGNVSAGALAGTAGRLALFLLAFVAIGMLIVPRLVRAVVGLDRPETTVVACVGLSFGAALVAQRFGYSIALGSFLAGSLAAESGQAERIEQLLQPVRDLFAAVFFVSVGMLIDPALVARHWAAVAVLTALVIAGKLVGVAVPAFLTGAGVRTSIQAGMSLAQIGEFSFVIAGLGLSLGATRDFLYPVAVAVSAVTTLLTPWLIRASGRFAELVDRKLPAPLQTFVALYATWIEGLRASRTRTPLGRLLRLLLLDGALLAAVAIASARFFERVAALLAPRVGAVPARIAVAAASAALAAPFVFGIARLAGALAVALAARALPQSAPGGLDLAYAPRRALIVALQMVIVVALGLPLLAVVTPFVPAVWSAVAVAGLLAVLGIRLWRTATDLQGHVRAGAQVVAEAFGPGPLPAGPAAEGAGLFPGLGSPVPFALPAASRADGQTLAALRLRGRTGATVLAIRREEKALLLPGAHEVLRAGDLLALAGTADAIEAAKAFLSERGATEP